ERLESVGSYAAVYGWVYKGDLGESESKNAGFGNTGGLGLPRARRLEFILNRSMLEVSYAGEHHRNAVLVRGGDHLAVPYRTPGLCYGGNPGLGGFVYTVPEREEGIRSED